MDWMAEDRTRVDFNAPQALVRRADAIADLLDISRTRLLIEALRDELDAVANDEAFQRTLEEAFYAGRIGFETVESIRGTEEALRMKLLRESLDREPPQPRLSDAELPDSEEFYAETATEWSGDESDEDEADTTA